MGKLIEHVEKDICVIFGEKILTLSTVLVVNDDTNVQYSFKSFTFKENREVFERLANFEIIAVNKDGTTKRIKRDTWEQL